MSGIPLRSLMGPHIHEWIDGVETVDDSVYYKQMKYLRAIYFRAIHSLNYFRPIICLCRQVYLIVDGVAI